MKNLLLLRVKLFFHQLKPFGILLVLAILDRAHIFHPLPLEPLLLLPMIYHWAIHRPEHLSAFMLFALGAIDDAISGVPIGQTSLVLLVLYVMTILQKHHVRGASFSTAWIGFSCYMALATLLEWGIVSVIVGDAVSLMPLILQNALAVALYPWFNKLIKRLEKRT